MKIIRRWYWLISGFLQKYLLGILIGIGIGIAAFIKAPALIKYLPIKPTRTIGRIGVYSLSQLPLDVQQKVSRGLTKVSQDGTYALDLAQSMNVSQDGKSYTFTINAQNLWANGEPLKAQDISLALTDVQSNSQDPQSITFTLKEPFSPFPSIISQPLLKKITVGRLFKRTKIIGTETYSISRIKTQNQYIQSLNLESKTDNLLYHFYPTEQEAITAYKLGHIDKIEGLTNEYLKDWPNTKVIKDETANRYLALFFNTANQDLQDKTIRQILTYATPKPDDDTRIISPIHRESWVYNPQVKPYHYNLQTAKSMMDKLKESNPNLALSVEITTTPTYTSAAQSIIDSWRELGIDAKLKVVTFPDTNDYDILLIGQQIPEDPDQYVLWHSTQSSNITHYQNPKIDKLLEDGRKERDRETRKRIYQDFQRFLVEDSPAAFLQTLPTYTIERR